MSEPTYALLKRLTEETREGRRMAIARELAGCGTEALVPHVLQLTSGNTEACSAAAFVLSEWANCGRVPPEYTLEVAQCLGHSSPEVRQWCAAALRGMGPAACTAEGALTRLLQDPDQGVRQSAVDALGQIAADKETVVLRLLDLLGDDLAVRNAVVRVLSAMVSPSQAIVRKLTALIRASDPALRAGAVAGAGALLYGRAELAPLIVERLSEDADAAVRSVAARALSEMSHLPRTAVLALGKALRDPEPAVRQEAARALDLSASTSAPAVPYLVAVLKDADATVRLHAVEALEKLAPAQPALLPAVVLALGNRLIDTDVAVQTRALAAFSRLAPYAYPLNPNLRAATQDADPEVRLAAVEALAQIRHEGLEVRETLRRALRDRDGMVRVAAALALAKRHDASSQIVPTLVEALGEPVARVQIAAIQALRKIGSGSEQALAALKGKRNDSNPEIRELAQQAIGSISGTPVAGYPN